MSILVGIVADFADPGRRVVDINGVEIAVFHKAGSFYAYENVCPHLGGPACQGKILPLTLEAVEPDRTSTGRVFSKDQTNVVCPWHGMEFNICTGEHPTNKRIRLRKIDLRVHDGHVFVTLPSAPLQDQLETYSIDEA
jgi:nitrite reductase/ring-hydroxylating ferredoxin subunit